MIITAHQPLLLPWVGFWNKAYHSDVLVLLAGTHYDPSDRMNRVKINGHWATLPVLNKHTNLLIKDAIFDRKALRKFILTLEHHYANQKIKYSHYAHELVDVIQSYESDNLLGLLVALILKLKQFLGIPTQIIVDTALSNEATKTTRLLSHLIGYQPTTYISGHSGIVYLEESELPFKVLYQKLKNPVDESILAPLSRGEDIPQVLKNACELVTRNNYICQ